MTGYDYGNARLRARRASLLRPEHYAGLLGHDLPGLLAALMATSYRPQAEAAAGASGGGLGVLYRVARDHLDAALADVPGLYRNRAGEVAVALLGPFGVHNVLTALRAAHQGGTAAVTGTAFVAAGPVDARTAREAAGQPDLPAAARLLAGRRLPDADSAAALLAAARQYELGASLGAVEHAVACAARAHQFRVLTAAGAEAEPAAAAWRRETDDANLLVALRLREAAQGRPGQDPGSPYLPGGTVPGGLLTAIQGALARADVLAAAAPAADRWRSPLTAWAERGDLAALQAALETERLRTELRLLRRADPLGAATILQHVLAHQAQARNIRLLARAAAGAVGHDAARQDLIRPV